MQKEALMPVLANPPGFSTPTLENVYNALVAWECHEDSPEGKSKKFHLEMLSKEIESRK